MSLYIPSQDPNGPLLTTLPAVGYDGQVVRYQSASMATDGIVWAFRYNASGGTYKWEFVGGPPWFHNVETLEATTSTSFTDLATTGPTLALPLAGIYNVAVTAYVGNGTATASRCDVELWQTGGTETYVGIVSLPATTSYYAAIGSTGSRLTVAAGDTVKMRYRNNTGATSISFIYRRMTITPIRVAGV